MTGDYVVGQHHPASPGSQRLDVASFTSLQR